MSSRGHYINGVPMAGMCDYRVRPVNGELTRVDDCCDEQEYYDTNDYSNNGITLEISINRARLHGKGLQINVNLSI